MNSLLDKLVYFSMKLGRRVHFNMYSLLDRLVHFNMNLGFNMELLDRL